MLTAHFSNAQQAVQYDSSKLEIRHLQYDRIKTYSEQKEFDYRENSAKKMSLWDRFWSWFWEQFYRITQRKSVQRGFEVFIWVFSISLMLFALYKLSGMEKRFFFQGSVSNKNLGYREEQDNIHSIDFNAAINDAIMQQHYRDAVRLMYLRNLKALSDRNLISFTLNKTNFDYSRELKNTSWAKGFTDTTMVYEYAWYGEFPIEKETFELLYDIFTAYEKTIRP